LATALETTGHNAATAAAHMSANGPSGRPKKYGFTNGIAAAPTSISAQLSLAASAISFVTTALHMAQEPSTFAPVNEAFAGSRVSPETLAWIFPFAEVAVMAIFCATQQLAM
jgi:hypothetical protein